MGRHKGGLCAFVLTTSGRFPKNRMCRLLYFLCHVPAGLAGLHGIKITYYDTSFFTYFNLYFTDASTVCKKVYTIILKLIKTSDFSLICGLLYIHPSLIFTHLFLFRSQESLVTISIWLAEDNYGTDLVGRL